MSLNSIDRSKVAAFPLRKRANRVSIERDKAEPGDPPGELSAETADVLDATAQALSSARERGASRMLAFGAHAIKNGLGPVLIKLMEDGWLTHLATNGAGIIHDWELAFLGETSEDVRENVAVGRFGNWEETGYFINLALNVGAWRGLGYGEAVGKMVEAEGLSLPERDNLLEDCSRVSENPARAAAAADLLDMMERFDLPSGDMPVPHPFKKYSAQAASARLGVPFTGHPMFGHDIIYNHPMNNGAALGRCAERDFLTFAGGVANLEGGVYLSIGSAVMSPMIFEKSLSMARNIALREGRSIDRFLMTVVDLQKSNWDWSKGEPPIDSPDYYLRFNKTFARMGGERLYASSDNRAFLLALTERLDALD